MSHPLLISESVRFELEKFHHIEERPIETKCFQNHAHFEFSHLIKSYSAKTSNFSRTNIKG